MYSFTHKVEKKSTAGLRRGGDGTADHNRSIGYSVTHYSFWPNSAFCKISTPSTILPVTLPDQLYIKEVGKHKDASLGKLIHGPQDAGSDGYRFQSQLNATSYAGFYWGTFLKRKRTRYATHSAIYFFYNHGNRLAVFTFPDRYYPYLEDQIAFVTGAIQQKLFAQTEKLKLAFSMNLSNLKSNA